MNLKPRLIPYLLGLMSFAGQSFGQIESGHSIRIEIKGVPQEEAMRVNGEYPVSEGDGSIRMPYIGSVRAAGLTQNQLAANIEAAYKSAKIYRTPTILIIADTAGLVDKMISVGGFVRRTGPVKWTKGLTIYQAIQAAGGENEFGSIRRVRLLRAGKLREYDVSQTQFKGVLLEPGDTIEVPQAGPFERHSG